MGRTHLVTGPNGLYELRPYTVEEEAARNAKEAAYTAGANDRAFKELRRERDNLLHDTDWWASNDLSITEEQVAYPCAIFPPTLLIQLIQLGLRYRETKI